MDLRFRLVFSIVAHEREADWLLVRARRPSDVERVFPDARVVQTTGRDYPSRAELPRKVVSEVIAAQGRRMWPTNFRSSVRDRELHSAYVDVWHRMAKLQPVPPYGRGLANSARR